MIKAPVERYPSQDKSQHWVFAANILIHCKGKIWTGTMSAWTVETYVHIKHSVSSVNKLTRVISVLSTRQSPAVEKVDKSLSSGQCNRYS